MSRMFDVVVIGAGPAGYVAAIRSAQLGMKTACIDAWVSNAGKPTLGGTCLNVGCIPSKALLESADIYYRAEHDFAAHGISISDLKIDIKTVHSRKEKLVSSLTTGIESLFMSNKITWLKGFGKLLDNRHVSFSPHTDDTADAETIEANHIILACGSEPIPLEPAPVDQEQIVDSSGALSFSKVPKRLGVIGGGVIGLELGSVWNNFGSEVVILEAQDTFLSMADHQIAHEAFKEFNRQGLDIRLGARVVSTEKSKKQVTVKYNCGEEEHEFTVDRLVVAVGRRPNTERLFTPESGLLLDERGFIHVNDECATNLPGVYAIGDAVRGPMLAHKGSEEGVAVAETIATGIAHTVNYNIVPSVIYTHPEIAWVGHSEQEAQSLGIPANVGTFPLIASGRALVMGAHCGMVKIVSHAVTDQILGVHIIGPSASELIAEAVLAMEFSASSEDLARTMHAHPTLSEAIHEAALAIDNRAIHIANRRKK